MRAQWDQREYTLSKEEAAARVQRLVHDAGVADGVAAESKADDEPWKPAPGSAATAAADGGVITFAAIDTAAEDNARLLVRTGALNPGTLQRRRAAWEEEWSALLKREYHSSSGVGGDRRPPYISSLSIIIPVYNMEGSIGAALESVEASVATFGGRLEVSDAWRTQPAHTRTPVLCEVIILDDASTDNTMGTIAEFVDPTLTPTLPPSVKLEYTLFRATVNGGQASGRNAAARRARGEILFFLDADDVFLPQHLIAGWSSLNNNETVAWVKTGIAIAENQGGERILAEWKEAMENGAPTNLAIRRSIFIFSEGYSPLDMFRRDHEDVMFTQAIEYVRQRLPIAGLTDEGQPHQQRRYGYAKVAKATVVYNRRPGNHLDTQIKSGKFAHPIAEQSQYDEWHRAGPERGRAVQEELEEQSAYLENKIEALLAFEAVRQIAVLV